MIEILQIIKEPLLLLLNGIAIYLIAKLNIKEEQKVLLAEAKDIIFRLIMSLSKDETKTNREKFNLVCDMTEKIFERKHYDAIYSRVGSVPLFVQQVFDEKAKILIDLNKLKG